MARNLESLVTGLGDAAETLRAVVRLHQRGVIDLTRPDRVARMARENRIYGPPAALIMAGARHYPHRPAIADERGVLTYGELDAQSNALANALLAQGLTAGSVVGVLARDHRGLVLAISAAGRAGLRLAMMNTGFAKPQFAEVAARENVRAMLHDSEFGDLLDALPPTLPRILTWVDEGHAVPAGARTVDELIDAGDHRMPPAPAQPGASSSSPAVPRACPRGRRAPR